MKLIHTLRWLSLASLLAIVACDKPAEPVVPAANNVEKPAEQPAEKPAEVAPIDVEAARAEAAVEAKGAITADNAEAEADALEKALEAELAE
jgi:hypothetical protein